MTESWGDVALLRQGLYRWFAAALLPPDDHRLAELRTGAKLLDGMGVDAFAFAGPWRSLLGALDERPPPDALETEYVRLFVVGADGARCPPIESFYVADPRGGTATVLNKLDREYQRLGVAPASSATISSDHAATELEVMSVLCERERQAWKFEAFEEVDHLVASERSFLQRHLCRWFPTFARQTATAGRLRIYQAIAEAAGAFVHHDLDLSRLLAEARLSEAIA